MIRHETAFGGLPQLEVLDEDGESEFAVVTFRPSGLLIERQDGTVLGLTWKAVQRIFNSEIVQHFVLDEP